MPRRLILALGTAAVLIVTACGGGGAASAPAVPPASEAPAASESAAAAGACAPSSEAGTVAAGMKDRAFDPATITAKVGDVVAWTNNDSVGHTATMTDDATCTTPNLGSGVSGAIQFTAAGSYAFFCKVHPDMKGTVEVS